MNLKQQIEKKEAELDALRYQLQNKGWSEVQDKVRLLQEEARSLIIKENLFSHYSTKYGLCFEIELLWEEGVVGDFRVLGIIPQESCVECVNLWDELSGYWSKYEITEFIYDEINKTSEFKSYNKRIKRVCQQFDKLKKICPSLDFDKHILAPIGAI